MGKAMIEGWFIPHGTGFTPHYCASSPKLASINLGFASARSITVVYTAIAAIVYLDLSIPMYSQVHSM